MHTDGLDCANDFPCSTGVTAIVVGSECFCPCPAGYTGENCDGAYPSGVLHCVFVPSDLQTSSCSNACMQEFAPRLVSFFCSWNWAMHGCHSGRSVSKRWDTCCEYHCGWWLWLQLSTWVDGAALPGVCHFFSRCPLKNLVVSHSKCDTVGNSGNTVSIRAM